MLLSGLSSYSATEICLGVGNGDYSSTYPGGNRTPVLPWYITQDGNVLTMSATPCIIITGISICKTISCLGSAKSALPTIIMKQQIVNQKTRKL